jgi:hypothetical protein
MSWKNWGDHPVAVIVSIISALVAVVFTIYDHLPNAAPPSPSLKVSPTPNATTSPSSVESSPIPTPIPQISETPQTPFVLNPLPIVTPSPSLQSNELNKTSVSPSIENIPTPSPSIENIPTPSPSILEPKIELQRLDLQSSVPSEFSDEGTPSVIHRYLVNVRQEQVLRVEVLDGDVHLNIRNSNGQLLDEDMQGLVSWEAMFPQANNLQIDAVATQPTDFRLRMVLYPYQP